MPFWANAQHKQEPTRDVVHREQTSTTSDSLAFLLLIMDLKETVMFNEFKTPGLTAEKMSLQDVKNVIAFPHDNGIGRSLVGLVDIWYAIAIRDGETHENAILICLGKLGEKLNELSN